MDDKMKIIPKLISDINIELNKLGANIEILEELKNNICNEGIPEGKPTDLEKQEYSGISGNLNSILNRFQYYNENFDKKLKHLKDFI